MGEWVIMFSKLNKNVSLSLIFFLSHFSPSLSLSLLDFCGDLDMGEWVIMFSKLNKNVSLSLIFFLSHFSPSLSLSLLDFCGDLDMGEWVIMFSKLNKNVSSQEARLIFMQIDKNCSGAISLSELVPVVFNKANRSQLRMILQYAGEG
jgi:Ca2+-binding EF-hand superfamily protein